MPFCGRWSASAARGGTDRQFRVGDGEKFPLLTLETRTSKTKVQYFWLVLSIIMNHKNF